jgi:hypothetical protein
MNLFCENAESSLTSRTHVLPKGEVTIRHCQGILEATRIHYGYEDTGTCRETNARVKSYPIYLHKYLNTESAHLRKRAVGRLHSEQNSSARVISDRPPSQPRSQHQMSGGPSNVSGKESHKDPAAGEAHEQGSSAFEEAQKSDSKWNSGSGPLTDTPPLHPHNRHGISGAESASMKEYHKDPGPL